MDRFLHVQYHIRNCGNIIGLEHVLSKYVHSNLNLKHRRWTNSHMALHHNARQTLRCSQLLGMREGPMSFMKNLLEQKKNALQHASISSAFYIVKRKILDVKNCDLVPCQYLPQNKSYNAKRELEKQSTIYHLIITLRHTMTVWTKERKTEDGKKKKKKKTKCIYLSPTHFSQRGVTTHCSILPCRNGNLDWCASSSYFSLPLTNNAQFHCISELLVIPTI